MRRALSVLLLLFPFAIGGCAPESSGIGWSSQVRDLTCDQARVLCGWTLEHPAGEDAAACAPADMTECLTALDRWAEPCAEVTVEQYESCILERRDGPCDSASCLIELCGSWPPHPPFCE